MSKGESMKAAWANKSPEERAAWGANVGRASKAYWANLSEEDRERRRLKMSAAAKRRWARQRRQAIAKQAAQEVVAQRAHRRGFFYTLRALFGSSTAV